MNNTVFDSSAMKLIKKQNELYKNLCRPPAFKVLEEQRKLYREIFEPIRLQQTFQKNIGSQMTSQLTMSKSLSSVSELLKSYNFHAKLPGLYSAAEQFAKALKVTSAINISSFSDTLLPLSHSITDKSFDSLPDYELQDIDADIATICVATENSLDAVQEYVTVEQFDELKSQINDLKNQIISSDTSEEKKFNIDRFIAIVAVLLSIFLHILGSQQDDQANQLLLDSQTRIIQSLENIDEKLDSHEQSQERYCGSEE